MIIQTRQATRPLPSIPPPQRDELLSSWLKRIAAANFLEPSDLCEYLRLPTVKVERVDAGLPQDTVDRIGQATKTKVAEVEDMTFVSLPETAKYFVSLKHGFQYCPTCTRQQSRPGRDVVELKHWRYAWILNCDMCGSQLVGSANIQENPPACGRSKRAARLLQQAAQNDSQRFSRRLRHAFRYASYLFTNISGPASLISSDTSTRYTALLVLDHTQRFPLAKAAWLYGTRPPIMREYLRNEYYMEKYIRHKVVNSPLAQKAAHRSMTPEPLGKILGDTEPGPQQTTEHDDYREAARNVVLRFQHSKIKKQRPTVKDAMKELRNIRQRRLAVNTETKQQLSQY